jgi:aquaporin NIP
MQNNRLLHRMVAEMIGTFIMMFMGCGSIMAAAHPSHFIDPLVIAPVWGLAVAISVYAVGHISGAHFNPAVTLAFAIARHFPLREVVAYWLAQVIGALIAVGLLSLLIHGSPTFGATTPHVATEAALLWEIILTFILMFVIISVATDTRAVGIMAGAAIGAAVMINAMVGGAFTGASMNPARSLAPAIAQGLHTHLWIYLTAPFIGAVLAALTYEWLRKGHIDNTA